MCKYSSLSFSVLSKGKAGIDRWCICGRIKEREHAWHHREEIDSMGGNQV